MDVALSKSRLNFERQTDCDGLHRDIEALRAELDVRGSRRDMRRRNQIKSIIAGKSVEIRRRRQKRALYNVLVTDVQEAQHIANAGRRRQHKLTTRSSAGRAVPKCPGPESTTYVDDAVLLLEDVTLLYDGHRLQDITSRMDDICTNCGSNMERNVQLSYLVCPRLECGHMRWYMDTSTYNSATYITRSEVSKNAPKCVTHYSTFLNTSQGKTTKRFSRDYLMKICYYCYVEGARDRQDISKEIINKAQKYIGQTEYNISTILKTQLRGDCLRLPPEVVKKLQLLFKAMWPVFASMKTELDTERANMINFNFVSRVLCRLLGYDVFLPLFDRFRMSRNEVRHSAFMRQMFAQLGWFWEDGKLTDISDALLDDYERRDQGASTWAGQDPSDGAGASESQV